MIRNEVDGTSVCLHHFPSKQSISSEKGDPIMASFLLRAVKSQTAARVIRRGWGGIPREARVYLPVAEQSSGSVAYHTKLCPPQTTTVFLFQLSGAPWSFLLIPPWNDIPVWIYGFIRGVIELKTLQMLDSGEHPADTWTLTQLYLRRLPVVPGCCDSYAVYASLSLLSFIFKRSVSSLWNAMGTVRVCKWASASSVLGNLE